MGQLNRKKPFGTKQKKVQIQFNHRRRKAPVADDEGDIEVPSSSRTVVAAAASADRYQNLTSGVVSINSQRGGGRSNRYNLQFCKAKLDAEFERSKREQHEPIEVADPGALEYTSSDFFPEGLTFPERPPGYQTMTKDQLDMLETKAVRLFGEEMESRFGAIDLNLYEQNVETWKQLWRVIDKSDVLLFIVDVRFAVCQFPPYLYRRLVSMGRGVVLVLSKVDLVPATLVLAWTQYFTHLCPGIQVVAFCSLENVKEKRRKMKLAVNSCRALIAAVNAVAPRQVDLSSWKQKLESEADAQASDILATVEEDSKEEEYDEEEQQLEASGIEDCDEEDASESEREDGAVARPNRAFTIGTIGYPNVGKSSLINAIMGKFMVGVSATPGFTKHFQTHYLTRAKDLLLCDCPGLVFPAICPYKLQVLSGTFPVAQVRSPMSVIGFLAAHINVPRALGLQVLPEHREQCQSIDKFKWTPFTVAEAWAAKRHYCVRGKGGRPDVSRAANELVRLSLAAKNKLVLSLKPKHYTANKASLEKCTEHLKAIRLIQGMHAEDADLQERILSFQHIPRGTKVGTPENTFEASGNTVRKRRNKRGAKPVMPTTEESSDEDDEESEEELSSEEVEVAKNTRSKKGAPGGAFRVTNAFAVLQLEEDDGEQDDDEQDDEQSELSDNAQLEK